MKYIAIVLLGVFMGGCATTRQLRQEFDDRGDRVQIEIVMSAWHTAASIGAFDLYFDSMTDDAVFMGTDASERWGKGAFMEYAREPFSDGHGWTYVASDQHVAFSADRRTAWIDEVLAHETYGTLRGTGVLVKVGDDWKIAQYSLTFLVPNEKAGAVVEVIGGE